MRPSKFMNAISMIYKNVVYMFFDAYVFDMLIDEN